MNLSSPRQAVVATKTVPPMKTKSLKRFQIHNYLFGAAILVALLATAFATLPASAQTIFWGAPTTISGDTDVSTLGTGLYAYTGGTSNGLINGVAFTASTSTTAWGSVGLSGVNANTTTAYAAWLELVNLPAGNQRRCT